MKLILHADINNFFASVECVLSPKLAGVPLAVAGNIETRSGIILAKNYLAKAKGVKTGDAIWQAKQKCPNLITVLPNYSAYRHFSKVVTAIYERYTDKIEGMGLDECWLDVTKTIHLFLPDKENKLDLFEKGEILAKKIQDTVFNETGLGISIGVSFNKLFAKLGSDMKKPKGITVLSSENFTKKTYHLPISDVVGIGRQTRKKLAKMNIFTIGDFAHADSKILKNKFGIVGNQMQQKILGIDTEEVGIFTEKPPPKSVGNGTTLVKDAISKEEIQSVLSLLCSKVAMRLREQNLGATCISVGIKTFDFNYFSHDKRIPFVTNNEKEIFDQVCLLLDSFWDYKMPVRSIRIATSRLASTSQFVQLSFFQNNNSYKLDEAVDKIRNKYGFYKIEPAKSFSSPKTSQSFEIEIID
ncbi:MAG: DNA polymerase IV [Clostridia bacterium]